MDDFLAVDLYGFESCKIPVQPGFGVVEFLAECAG